ncbi:MAG: helix-turn-helix transcriptional regulator [Candidatus Thiodiazotropha sp.]
MEKSIANCYHPGMVNIRTIRKSNLLAQIDRFGSQRAFAERADLAPAHVSQLVTERRNMGDEVARRIERNLNLEEGHMDIQHHSQAYPQHRSTGQMNRIADSDATTHQSQMKKLDPVQQRLSGKTRKIILKIERAAIEEKLSDEDWEILERLVDRFERDV